MIEGLISIITPVYNAMAFFKETFDSVMSQTYKSFEWLITDDCSTDGTYEYIQELIKDYPQIKLFRNATNSGSAVSRNNSMRHAEGQYFSFIDADDLWTPIFLEEQLAFMKKTDSRLVYSSYSRLASKSNTIFRVKPKSTYKSLLYSCDIAPSTVLYNVEQYGVFYFREDLKKREDYAYWLNMLKKFPFGRGNRKCLVTYRVVKTSKTYNKKKLWKYQYAIYREVEQLSCLASIYYLCSWAIRGFFKYLFVR